jgi:hypothetical protein
VRSQRVQQRRASCGVEEHGLAADLHPRRQCLERGVFGQCQRAHAIGFHHVGLQVLGDQVARRALGDLAAVVQHQQARAQALGLVHEMGGQQDGLALLQQQLQPLPHQVAGLRVQPGGGLVQQQQLAGR